MKGAPPSTELLPVLSPRESSSHEVVLEHLLSGTWSTTIFQASVGKKNNFLVSCSVLGQLQRESAVDASKPIVAFTGRSSEIARVGKAKARFTRQPSAHQNSIYRPSWSGAS